MAWVDPINGLDTADPADQISDPDMPFKTLQLAIDTLHAELVAAYNNPAQPVNGSIFQGTVYALPGIYGPAGGPNGPNASGDLLPIQLKDRVHVQGAGAGRCFLREYRTDPNLIDYQQYTSIYWPATNPNCSTHSKGLFVLLDVTTGSVGNPNGTNPLPWFDPNLPSLGQDCTEVFDGFTFQGGDVQVLARSGFATIFWTLRAIISNCVFDMRDGWAPDLSAPTQTIAGPSLGVMMLKALHGHSGAYGYTDQELLILGNTFVMAQFGQDDWVHSAENDAVAIIDVSSPNCGGDPCDCDDSQRGLGHPGIVNNLFRTLPGSEQRALVGIDAEDTLIGYGPTPENRTNAFAAARVGDNATYGSLATGDSAVIPASLGIPNLDPLWDCTGASQAADCSTGQVSGCTSHCTPGPLPTPRVDLFDGSTTSTTDRDPSFVGEFLASQFTPDVGEEYADWRLLPGIAGANNPLKNGGFAPAPAETTIQMANGVVFQLPDHPLAPNPFRWDGEGYGNPRVVDGAPDIGHDEIHLFTMTGSYSPNSRSHNDPTPGGQGCLNPDLPDGQPKRILIFRAEAGGVTFQSGANPTLVEVHGNHEDAAPLCPAPTAWSQPPGTLPEPVDKATLPIDFRTKYIRFTDVSLPSLPWGGSVTGTVLYRPLMTAVGDPPLEFVVFTITDDETTAGTEWYFNTQAEILDDTGTVLLRSNMQAEYR